MQHVSRRVATWVALLVVLVGTAAAGIGFSIAPAEAADNGSFSIEPTSPKGAIARQYLVYDVPAGGTLNDSVTVTNHTDVPQNFLIYGADGYTTDHDGGFGLKKSDEEQVAVGSWITTGTGELSLLPGASVKVPITIEVPEGTAPGDHSGAVVALNTAVQPGGGDGLNIGIQRAVATRVYLRVQGAMTPGLEVQDVRLDTSGEVPTVRYVLANTGNTRLDPTSLVSLTGVFGRSLQALPPADVGTLLPGETSEYAQELDGLPLLDYVTAKVAVTTPEVTASGQTSVLLIPWRLIVAVIVILLAIIGYLYYRRRRRKQDGSEPLHAAKEAAVTSA